MLEDAASGQREATAREKHLSDQSRVGQAKVRGESDPRRKMCCSNPPTPKINLSDHKNVHITDNFPCTRHCSPVFQTH